MKHRIGYEFSMVNTFLVVSLGILFAIINFSVWCAVGSPAVTLRFISSKTDVIPLWLYGFFDFLSFGLLGGALGADIGAILPTCREEKYRGAFFFLICVILAYLHHVFFFSHASFFMSFILSVLAVVFLVVALCDFYYVSKAAFYLGVIGGLWQIYVAFISIVGFFTS